MLTSLSLAVALGLGVGAIDSNSITVLLDGKPTKIVLAGVAAGDARGGEFVQCLVAGRVLRITGPHSAAHATMLDDTNVAAHIDEFLQTQTTSDPCTLGKAAYQPKPLSAAAAAAADAPLPVVKKKKAVREVHVSFSGGGGSSTDGLKLPPALPPPAQPYTPPAQAAPQPAVPTYANPVTVLRPYTPPSAGTATAPTMTTTSVGSTGTQPLPQQPPEQLPQQPTQTIPTTTYAPPPPPM